MAASLTEKDTVNVKAVDRRFFEVPDQSFYVDKWISIIIKKHSKKIYKDSL